MIGNEATAMPGRDEKLLKGFVVPNGRQRETLAAQRRRESRREEFAEQVRLVEMLQELLDPAFMFFSALENRPRSALAGALQRRQGVRAGLPDLMIVAYWKPPVFVEMKSKRGVPSPAQRRVFADLRAMGADVYVARSAAAALEALRWSNVPFRQPWQPPQPLADWEGPFIMTDPNQRLPQEPGVRAERRVAQRRWRQRQRERKAGQQSCGRGSGSFSNVVRDRRWRPIMPR
jgi:hypothetical protein